MLSRHVFTSCIVKFLLHSLWSCIVSNKKYVVFTSLYLKNGPFFLWLLMWYAWCSFSTPPPHDSFVLVITGLLGSVAFQFSFNLETFAHYFLKYFFLCIPPLPQIRNSKYKCVRLLQVIPQLTFWMFLLLCLRGH